MGRASSCDPSSTPQVRAASFATYFDVADELGVDPYLMLRRFGIRPEDLIDPENRLPAQAAVNLLEETARRTGCRSVGVRMVERRDFALIGPLTLLLQHCSTMRETVLSMIEHQRLLNDVVEFSLDEAGDTTLIQINLSPGFATPQTIEFATAVFLSGLLYASGGQWRPECIHFRHAAWEDLTVHKRYFGCPLEFDSEFDGMSCASASLDIANPTADRDMAEHAGQCVKLLLNRLGECSFRSKVRQLTSSRLGHKAVTIEGVADALGVQPRSLQRQLRYEGTTFAAVLNSARHDLAQRYLATSSRSVTEVSILLGYSAPSSFSRWFMTEFGQSPATWRDRAQCRNRALRH